MKWFCSFKAYGDLVITCNFLHYLNPLEYGLLAGSHLQPLLRALHFNGSLISLDAGTNVPAFFDTHKCGYINTLRSGFQLRRRVMMAMDRKRDTLVFDALGVRQRFLAWPRQIETIRQGEPNIYLDYSRYLEATTKRDTVLHSGINKVAIFPDSRIKDKVLTDELLVRLYRESTDRGIQTVIIKIGQATPLPSLTGCKVRWIDGFDKLIQEITSAGAVVSADTLPAHLAEYYDVPVFVFTPKRNDYWMPLTVYLDNNCSEFDDLSRYRNWVHGD